MSQPRRKGAMRIADIPPDVLRALNAGREETITLIEWLAIDMPALLRTILLGVGLAEAREELVNVADGLAGEGVTVRLKQIGEALYKAIRNHPRHAEIYEALASHSSDMVRAWAPIHRRRTKSPHWLIDWRLRAGLQRIGASRCVKSPGTLFGLTSLPTWTKASACSRAGSMIPTRTFGGALSNRHDHAGSGPPTSRPSRMILSLALRSWSWYAQIPADTSRTPSATG